MTKPVMLSEDIAKELKRLKEERNESYSSVIRHLLTSQPEADLDEINKLFETLKILIPPMGKSLELMRIITVRYYRLRRSEQKAKDGMLNEILESGLKHIVKEVVKENGRNNR